VGILRSFARAALLRCPHCGAHWRRAGWIALVPRCGWCGIRLDRGETDAFFGGFTVSLLAALLLTAALVLAAIAWGHLGAGALEAIAVVAIAVFVPAFHPFGRLLWLAGDLAFRPPRERDFQR
jgi:uncharacterized protein (DUF983 family)